jgi:hypothetical protein
MMSPQIVLGHCFFSQEDVQLASLIPDIDDIDLDSLENVLLAESTDYTARNLEDVTTAIRAASSNNFFPESLTGILQRSAHANLDLTAHNVYTLKIRHSRSGVSVSGRRSDDGCRNRLNIRIRYICGRPLHFV